MPDTPVVRHGRLILVPAVITLAVTLLRLAGELLHWSPLLFNPEAGGGGALVGIVWLVPVFGVYFALKIARAGEGPGRIGRALAYVILALVLPPASGALAGALGVSQTSTTMLFVVALVSIVAIVVAMRGWPTLGRVLTVYGLAARVPVAIVMLIAIFGDWGTHYDVPPSADFPAMAPLAKWFLIGLVPQLTFWVAFTVIVGMLFGIVAVALVHRGRRAATA